MEIENAQPAADQQAQPQSEPKTPSITDAVVKRFAANAPPKQEPSADQQPVTVKPDAASAQDVAPQPSAEPRQTEPQVQPADGWKEKIKGMSLKELLELKEAPKPLASAWDEYEKNGDLKSWAKEYVTDYRTMDAKEVLRIKIQAEFAGIADADKLEKLYKHELAQYNIDTENSTEDEIEIGMMKLERDILPQREKLIAAQGERLLPTIDPKAEADKVTQSRLAEVQQKTEANRNFISTSEDTKKFLTEKKITIGSGADAYHIPFADAQASLDIVLGFTNHDSIVKDEKGAPTVKNQLLITAFAQDPEKFIAHAIAHGEKVREKKNMNTLENPSRINQPNGANPQSTDIRHIIRQAQGQPRS